MSIALTPKLAAAVCAAVANGEYVSSSEVVREALRDWQLRRDDRDDSSYPYHPGFSPAPQP
jgi:antitoxin ParD1/3/4